MDYRSMAKLAGAARGVQQGINNYQNVQAKKQALEQQKSTFDVDMKIKGLMLDKAEMEGNLAPERLSYEREKMKLEKKRLESQASLASLKFKELENEIKNDTQQKANALKTAQSILAGNDLGLPSGSTLNIDYGGGKLQYKQPGIEDISEEEYGYVERRAAELKKKDSGLFKDPEDDLYYMRKAREEFNSLYGNKQAISNDDDIFSMTPESPSADSNNVSSATDKSVRSGFIQLTDPNIYNAQAVDRARYNAVAKEYSSNPDDIVAEIKRRQAALLYKGRMAQKPQDRTINYDQLR